METVLSILQVISAVLLLAVVMIQEKGSGIGEALGGSAGGSSFETTKRGAEKVLSYATVVILAVFIALSLVLNFL